MTPTIAILCLLIGALFSRALLRLFKIMLCVIILAFAVRVILILMPELQGVDYSSIGLGAFGAAVAIIAGYRLIHNWLVDADLSRQIERDKQQAAARRI